MADIETRLFRYFVALAHELHFGRAAAQLGISAPTLTIQIRKLESQLDAKLFERRGNTHVSLTAAGARFLDHARNVLHEANLAASEVRAAARGEVGRLEIGFLTVLPMTGIIQELISEFQQANPRIDIRLQQMVTPVQIDAVLNRDIDIGFVRQPHPYPFGLQGFVVYRQPMLLALPAHHPLAARERIAPADLLGESFIATVPNFDVSLWKQTETVANLGGFTPKIAKRVKDMISTLTYVAAGQGVAVVSTSLSCIAMPNVVYREFDSKVIPTATMALIHRRGETAPAVRALIRHIRSHPKYREAGSLAAE